MLAIIAKYTGLPTAQIEQSIAYVDPEARLDVGGILRQIAWFRSQGMVKGDFAPDSVIDERFAVSLSE